MSDGWDPHGFEGSDGGPAPAASRQPVRWISPSRAIEGRIAADLAGTAISRLWRLEIPTRVMALVMTARRPAGGGGRRGAAVSRCHAVLCESGGQDR